MDLMFPYHAYRNINILTSHITNFIEATYITVYSTCLELYVLTGSTGANF
jgi:hypothetical protein